MELKGRSRCSRFILQWSGLAALVVLNKTRTRAGRLQRPPSLPLAFQVRRRATLFHVHTDITLKANRLKKSRVVKINIKHSRGRSCAVNFCRAEANGVQFCSALKTQIQLRFFQLPTSLSRLWKRSDIGFSCQTSNTNTQSCRTWVGNGQCRLSHHWTPVLTGGPVRTS